MGERHARPDYVIVNRDEIRGETTRKATQAEREGGFRFSEMVTRGTPPEKDALLRLIAPRMTERRTQQDGTLPAGFTYLGQFVDHDLTLDKSPLTAGDPNGLPSVSARSPALDLDSVYGGGPTSPDLQSRRRYEEDGVRLRLGTTQASGPPPVADKDMPGFDLPRLGAHADNAKSTRLADIPDQRNDENLAVAQVHLAFMRFHNAMADSMPGAGFEEVRKATVLHYQWMVVHDFLPRIVEQSVLDDVFTNGRKVFEVGAKPSDPPTMPIEFSVAAYRLGHSMIRAFYDWNAVFNLQAAQAAPAPLRPLLVGSLENLFRFSGTSGNLSPFASGSPLPPDPNARPSDINNPIDGEFDRLPSNWVADFTRLFDFARDMGDSSLAPPQGGLLNMAHRIDTLMTDPLADLPHGSFGARGDLPADPLFFNLAFRNLLRGRQVRLATAQEVANHFQKLGAATPMLTSDQILGRGTGGVDLTDLSGDLLREATTETPLWFYILREAEVRNGKLGPIGGRIVAETFHRVIEGSHHSILREKGWRPQGGRHKGGYGMVDILFKAYGRDGLRPVAVAAPAPVPA